MERYLIAGLGNPGKAYEGTRHNMGFAVVRELAKKYHFEFRKKTKWKGSFAEGKIGDASTSLLIPLTYMNLSGEAIAPVMRDQNIALSHFLVVVDDVAIPLGQLRLRASGSSGGHNGLKSIEERLQTNEYARLRIGVGDRDEGDLSEHVLSKFSPEEKPLVPEILERAVRAIEVWLEQGINRAMDYANPSNPSKGNL